jgi:plasmid stabilization system protein ParE
MLPVVFRPEAAVDVIEARQWYDNQQEGLGDDFGNALVDVVERLQAMPLMYVIVVESVHRAKLRRFPYLLYYRVLENQIEVLAVLHSSRDPRLWRQRVR